MGENLIYISVHYVFYNLKYNISVDLNNIHLLIIVIISYLN